VGRGSACSIGLFLSAPNVSLLLFFSWFFSSKWSHAHLGTIHLIEPGLYAAIYQGIIHFSRNLSSLHDFKQSLTLLFTVISGLERNATMIQKSIDCIDDCGGAIGTTINRQES
jgi:hypothetical protein